MTASPHKAPTPRVGQGLGLGTGNPLLYLLIGWILGLLLPYPAHPIGAFLGVLLLGAARFLKNKSLVIIALVPLASWHLSSQAPRPSPHDASHIAPLRHAIITGTVLEDPQFDGENTRFSLAPHLLIRPYPQSLEGKIMAYFQGPPHFNKGDTIQCTGKLSLPARDANFEGHSLGNRLKQEGIFSTLRIRRLTIAAAVPQGLISRLRKKAYFALSKGLSENQGRLFAGITFGAALYPVPDEIRTRYQEVGLAHILAASGVQVSLLATLFTGFLLKRHRTAAALVGIFTVVGYSIIAGACPSIIRAALMTSAGLVGILLGRPLFPFFAFLGSALLMLIYRPLWLWDIGFQFSFIATWALLSTQLKTESKALSTIQLPLAVTLWILPIQVYHFGQCSPYGVLANILAGLLVSTLTYLGFATAIAVSVLPILSQVMAPVNARLLFVLDALVKGLLALPGSHFNLHLPLVGLCFIYACFALWHLLQKERRWIWGPLLLLLIGIWTAGARHPPELYFLSVGQGDAIVIRTAHDRWVLVDSGPPTQHKLLPFLRKRGCNAIELVILTHPHADHLGGFLEIAEQIPIKRVWESGAPFKDPLHDQVLGYLLTHRIPFSRPQQGTTCTIDGVLLKVLSPDHPFSRNPNANSLVVQANIKEWKTLLTGDAEEKLERELLRAPQELQAHILKVAHHGSRFASSPAFLRAVGAQFGVVSVGPNSFRQPDTLTLERLNARMKVLRTDEQGAVRIRLSKKLEVQSAH